MLRQVRLTDDPFTSPSRSAGGEGGVGVLTKIRISFDGPLRSAPANACIRT